VSGTDAISPTAHYTGYVWAHNGLSHPELETREGRVLFDTMRPLNAISQALGGLSLETYLLTRHRAIDALLEHAIEEAGIGQVVEVACGLSPRGWRFAQRYGERLTYIEADLPAMATRKRRALERMGALSDRHSVVDVDALKPSGRGSLAEIASRLDPAAGLAIITEGLLGYLPSDTVDDVWRRFARVLEGFDRGRYISDLHLGVVQNAQVRIFRVILSAFVRGRVYLHFEDAADAQAALLRAGFDAAELHWGAGLTPSVDGRGGTLAHILEASIR
jgi:O-methyltransferase involved in polyketide biosynthesis